MKFNRNVWVIMVMALAVMAACSNSGEPAGNGGSAASDNGTATTSPSDTSAGQESQTGEAPENLNLTGFPIVNEKITLTSLSGQSVFSPPWNETLLFQEYEKMTNIHIEWDLPANADLAERRNLLVAGQTYPDMFYSALLSANDLMRYGSQGIIIPLNDVIEAYAPNLTRLFEQYPEIRKQLTMPDGNIYSLPRIVDPEYAPALAANKLWINREWLNNLGLPVPETTEQFYETLKAFVENDANGNNEKDELGYSFITINTLVQVLNGAYGIANPGAKHPYVEVAPGTNELRFAVNQDRHKEVLEFVHKLYSEGLIDPEVFTQPVTQFYTKISTPPVAGTFLSSSVIDTGLYDTYVGVPALEGPYGDKLFTLLNPVLDVVGAFAISKTNEHPEASVRWIDYFYSEEGSKLFYMGVEGVTYQSNPDGSVQYVEEIANHPEGIARAMGAYVIWPGTSAPVFMTEKYFKGVHSMPHALEATEKIKPYFVEPNLPDLNLTSEENEEMSALKADIETYVLEMRVKFITGDIPFSEWETYVGTLDRMGLDRYMEIYQSAYTRFIEQ